MSRRIVNLVVLLALMISSLLTAVACDPGAEITYVNQTNQRIGVYLGDNPKNRDLILEPQETREGGTIKAVWQDVVVFRNDQGEVLYRMEITWDELERQGYRIVITPKMIGQ